MRTYLFIPPLRKVAGGLAVLLRMASLLHHAGFDAVLVPRDAQAESALPLPDVPVLPFDQAAPGKQDIWLVPEGWVNALAPGLRQGARCVVYVQNWAYLLSSLPPDVAWQQLPVSFLSVSQPVAWFVEQVTGSTSPILRPGIDLDLFSPPEQLSWSGKLRIAFMPRKNKALLERTREILTARLQLRGLTDSVEWLAIENCGPEGVADILRRAHVFLATGFPEGCPLPPLEAMACGCLVVGFAGYGGWDYLRQAYQSGLGAGHHPWWPERDDFPASDLSRTRATPLWCRTRTCWPRHSPWNTRWTSGKRKARSWCGFLTTPGPRCSITAWKPSKSALSSSGHRPPQVSFLFDKRMAPAA